MLDTKINRLDSDWKNLTVILIFAASYNDMFQIKQNAFTFSYPLVFNPFYSFIYSPISKEETLFI